MGLRCDTCEKEMTTVTEPLEYGIGDGRFLMSDPVTYFRCGKCADEDVSGKELKKAAKSVVRIFLEKLARGEEALSGENIRWLRAETGLTVTELSQKIKVTPHTLGQWEARNKKFYYPMARGMAGIFADLLGGTDMLTRKEATAIRNASAVREAS